jgi:hypothetical protein
MGFLNALLHPTAEKGDFTELLMNTCFKNLKYFVSGLRSRPENGLQIELRVAYFNVKAAYRPNKGETVLHTA